MRRVFVSIRPLLPGCRPCHVTRHLGMTLVAAHPGTSKVDIVQWCVDNLTDEEANELRRAYGQPDRGEPLDDWMLEGCSTHFVPTSLRLTGAPAVQGVPWDISAWLESPAQVVVVNGPRGPRDWLQQTG